MHAFDRQTDGQTDRQTDRKTDRNLIVRPRLHSMQRGKKAQTINISPLRVGDAPELIDMPFGVLSGVPDVITNAKFYLNRLRGFSAAAPRKWPFPIRYLFERPLQQYCITVQTVMMKTPRLSHTTIIMLRGAQVHDSSNYDDKIATISSILYWPSLEP